VEIPLPNRTERTAILAIHGKSKTLAPDVDLDVVSRGTPGFSGADLANLVNEAAINAVRDGRHVLNAADFDTARDRLLIGRREASNALLPGKSMPLPSTRPVTRSSPSFPRTPTPSRRSPSCPVAPRWA
jgi:ATP-dependent Zn proteases